MIISRTPLRVSFFGGGTDLSCFVKNNKGLVLGSAIDKYIYHIVSRFHSRLFDHSIRLNYSRVEHVSSLTEIQHKPFLEILKFFDIQKDLEVHVASDLPAFSGLGSSSSFTVGLINAINSYKNKTFYPMELTKNAIYIEQKILNESVGSQDQTFASFGGFNLISFEKDDIKVEKIKISKSRLAELNSNLMLFFTGITRKANDIENQKIKNYSNTQSVFKELIKHVEEAYTILYDNRSLTDFGLLLNKTWVEKKKLNSDISSQKIDEMYTLALNSGAIGGKILGAGGGGFLLLYVPNELQKKVKKALMNFYDIEFSLGANGSEIIYKL